MTKHTLNRLSQKEVEHAKAPGRYSDGGGLSLVVTDDGRKRWTLRYTRDGKTRDMGLGPARDVKLAEVRKKAEEARKLVREGKDPIAVRQEQLRENQGVPTFGDMTDQLLASLVTGFRNDKHRDQWKMTLTEYAAPLRRLRVDQVTTEDVLSVLAPIWATKNETASRLRGRIERVLDAASAKGFRRDANPARWKGHLDHLLPARPKKHLRGHHAALAVDTLPMFMARLRTLKSVSARALEFAILTAARSGEVIGMTWPEVDLEKGIWTVPAARMKAGREHRVPLSSRALEILKQMKELESGFVFPGAVASTGLSNMSMTMVVRRMGAEITVHGFRSTFRDWAGDRTDYPREVAEAALAHVVGDETERAYRRGDALEKRKALMDSWAEYAATPAPEVG